MNNVKMKNIILALTSSILLISSGYYSYIKDINVRTRGIYSIATINSINISRNGWKIVVSYPYSGNAYTGSGLDDLSYYNKNDVGKRLFIKFLMENPGREHILIPFIQVPDSIKTPPQMGWSEEWMKQQFPKVVEYVHDTR
jgi:hypothetical protein